MLEELGTVTGMYRYPIKSMLGEKIERSWGDDRGVIGDRAFAVVDCASGKIASAKNPRLWKDLLFCGARYVQAPCAGSPLPPRTDPSADRRRPIERRQLHEPEAVGVPWPFGGTTTTSSSFVVV